jgi:hypothetical protein
VNVETGEIRETADVPAGDPRWKPLPAALNRAVQRRRQAANASFGTFAADDVPRQLERWRRKKLRQVKAQKKAERRARRRQRRRA